MKIFLLTRPEYDYVTSCLSAYAKKLINMAEERSVKVIDLVREKANASTLNSYIKSNKPRLVMFNGHGNGKSIFGHKTEPLISYGENEELLNGTITYALACESTKLLGESCITADTDAYIGYKERFALAHDPQLETNPLNDPMVKSFLEPSNMVIASLLKGNTVEEAYNKSQRAFQEEINKHILNVNSPESAGAIKYLVWNKNIQVIYGKRQATF